MGAVTHPRTNKDDPNIDARTSGHCHRMLGVATGRVW